MRRILASNLALLSCLSALADPAGPAFPPPGGVTTANSGTVAADTVGRTLFYTGFNPASYSELYWTFYDIRNPRHSSQGDTGAMSFAGYNAGTGIATWQSTANMNWSTLFGVQSIGTRLRLQFQPYTGIQSGQLGGGWLTPTTASAAGITSLLPSLSVLAVDDLPNPDNYQVWFRFETVAGTPLLDYYDSSQSLGGGVQTSATGGFYSIVPEPTSAGLMALGAGLLVLKRRKMSV